MAQIKYDIDELITTVDNARIAAVGVQESELKHVTNLVAEKVTAATAAKSECSVELQAVKDYIMANPGTGSAELA